MLCAPVFVDLGKPAAMIRDRLRIHGFRWVLGLINFCTRADFRDEVWSGNLGWARQKRRQAVTGHLSYPLRLIDDDDLIAEEEMGWLCGDGCVQKGCSLPAARRRFQALHQGHTEPAGSRVPEGLDEEQEPWNGPRSHRDGSQGGCLTGVKLEAGLVAAASPPAPNTGGRSVGNDPCEAHGSAEGGIARAGSAEARAEAELSRSRAVVQMN